MRRADLPQRLFLHQLYGIFRAEVVHIVADVFHIPVLLQEGDQIVLADMRQAEQILAPEFRLKEKPLLDNHLFHAHERRIVRTYPVFIFRFPFRLPVLFRCRCVVVFHLRSEENFTRGGEAANLFILPTIP